MQQEKDILFDYYASSSMRTKEEMKELDDVFLKLEAIQKTITHDKIMQCETLLAQLDDELTAFINSKSVTNNV